ncbi:hypothetical protein QJS10_CPA06g01120 [Acorus calamus]|uniref:Uncharacterized protein n=1 Tax=Acorus calamus TaxID=4465 RepID=A0AAV9EPZ9_ACOCL|nr:hypothetical protein QJS10_CPA06g01120 [Acorus calamus]
MAARNILLFVGSISVGCGQASLRECMFTEGASTPEGELSAVFLRGLPLLWRTEDVVRRVVEPVGILATFDEMETNSTSIPLVRARIWRRKGEKLPAVIEAELGGWVVKIEVLLDENSCRPRSWRWWQVFQACRVGAQAKPLVEARRPPHPGWSPPFPKRASQGRRRRKPRKRRTRKRVRRTTTAVPVEEEETHGSVREETLQDKRVGGSSVPGMQGESRGIRSSGDGRPCHSPQV